MGYMDKRHVELAAEHLLHALKHKPSVRYSEFYNEQPGSAELLALACGSQSWMDCAPLALDCAVVQLEEQGLVVCRRDLPEELIDGNLDYEISLTKKGQRIGSGVDVLPFKSIDL